MKSWKTTIGGLATALGMALIAIAAEDGCPPWLKLVGIGLSVFGPALLGVAARDNNVSSEQAGAKPEEPPRAASRTWPVTLLLAGLAFGLSGCATATQHAKQVLTTETRYPDGRVVTVTEERGLDSSLLAAGDARQSVESLKATNGKTLSLGAAGVQEDTSTQGLLQFFQILLQAGARMAVPIAVPMQAPGPPAPK